MADHGLTDEELDSLSEAEREAILADADDADDAAADDLDADVAAADDEIEAAAPAGDATDEPPEFTPRIVVEAPADAEAQLAALNERKDTLRTQLNDGDIGLDEFTSQLDAIGKEERGIERQVWEAESAQKQNDQVDAQRWKWEQEQFFAAESNKQYKDKYLLTALDAAIKDLANDPANASKKGGWFLTEADKMIRERFGMAKADKPLEPPKKPRPNIPPTLGNLPAAELPETGGGNEFAKLDGMSPFELEAALAKMTPEQEARYLAGA